MTLRPFDKSPVGLVVMMGLVSLFADIAYQGARSITGPYMAILGASGFAVSFVAGFGELLGYGLRIFSGYLTDKTKKYWGIAMTGYVINLVSVPLMGLATGWRMAATFIFTERIGKAIRVPARDTILSYAAKKVGAGFGYGLHEALDNVGALAGPLLMALFFYWGAGYKGSFLLLCLPAFVAIAILSVARKRFPHPENLEKSGRDDGDGKISGELWVYIIAVSIVGMGYSDFPLIAYHVKKRALLEDAHIPLLYSLAMVAAGIAALSFGRLFDRLGLYAVILGVLCSTSFSWFAFMCGASGVFFGIVLWGVGMAVQGSVMKATIANLIASSARGKAFGIFNASYGIFSFVGSAIIGLLYDKSVVYLVYFSVASHLLAILLLFLINGEKFNQHLQRHNHG